MAVAVALAGGGLAIWNTQRGNAVIYITAPVELLPPYWNLTERKCQGFFLQLFLRGVLWHRTRSRPVLARNRPVLARSRPVLARQYSCRLLPANPIVMRQRDNAGRVTAHYFFRSIFDSASLVHVSRKLINEEIPFGG